MVGILLLWRDISIPKFLKQFSHFAFLPYNKGRTITPTKESVDFGKSIGKYYDKETGKYYDTSRVTIHYDSKGNAHIVPARPTNFR